MPVNTNDLRDMASEFRETTFTEMVIEAANQLDSTRTERNILRAELDAAREEMREVDILKRLAPEYYQWPGKAGAELAPEWLQHRLKYGGASVDGDILAVYDWHDRRSLAAPGDYVVDGEKGLYVLVNARAALRTPPTRAQGESL
jgi:hypothetical protein